MILFRVTGVTPSVWVILQGAVPVNVTVRLVDRPLQIIFVPLITAVGRGFTVTTALPLRSATIEVHLLSLAAVRL